LVNLGHSAISSRLPEELKPLNRDYSPIILSPEDADEFRVVGEFVGVI
jgi:SOS-response transcriptional repressor LexA